ncbi:MAG: methionine--tRNA ligase subunit beta [Candidatus Auribacter fodinae]|jgi:methionyl-tRNA synthetase|uniref:Methionine--tRNA ligase n=1 Tax=Candidatus Auribacter fodinae TaxID=2093366 RepID=A0A3A4RFI0_9BACT|nr:MAG: methionine--tRNA ligase subunit beta [Candidatus Auribacter fodinae]
MEEQAKQTVSQDDGLIDIKEFFSVKLRVAQILTAEPVPETEKLMKLSISLGDEERTLVAGIAQYYSPEQLIGKKIVVVANLKPAKLRGIVSQGMLLAARDEKGLALLTVDSDVAPGSSIG